MEDLRNVLELSGSDQKRLLLGTNDWLARQTVESRVLWALENLPSRHVLSSSFGIQSAVMLHLLTRHQPDIPILLMDTGYLFPETYQFIEQLTDRLQLNLRVYRARMSPAWQEAKFGRLWEQGEGGLRKFNTLNKVEPMQRALTELEVGSWFSGLRQSQSSTRRKRDFLEMQGTRLKLHPIVNWSNRDVHAYLKKHDLPYHPLWEQGYVSVGDIHTTRKLEPGMLEEDTRFFGVNRECGLHSDVT